MVELAKATGFTKKQVNQSLHENNGQYSTTLIMFTRDFIQNAPTLVMTSKAILEYCANARSSVANRDLYHKKVLVNKYPTIIQAYNACPKLPVSFKGVFASLS